MTSSNYIWDPDGETGPNLHLPVGVSRITASGHAYHLEAQLRTGTLEGERWYRASVAM